MLDPEIKMLAKEAKERLSEMGVIKPGSPIDDFKVASDESYKEKYKDIFGNFAEISIEPALRITPFCVVPLEQKALREKTAAEREEFIWLHEEVECYLHSNIPLYEAGTFQNLTFHYNPTRWSNVEFWNIPHSKKIKVPRHVVLWVNKTCTPNELVSRELTVEEIQDKLHLQGYCESGRYYLKRSSRPQYYFTASAAPVPSF